MIAAKIMFIFRAYGRKKYVFSSSVDAILQLLKGK